MKRLISICYFEDDKVKEFFYPLTLREGLRFFVFRPRVCILSFKNIILIKKRYPKINKRYIRKVLEEDIFELFSRERYDFFFHIFSQREDKLDLYVWLYDKEIAHKISALGCSHLIPEPYFYLFQDPTLFILERANYYLLVHSENKKLIDLLTTKEPTEEILNIFLKQIEERENRRCIIYIKDVTKREYLENLISQYFTRYEFRDPGDHLLFLDYFKEIKLKEFKFRSFMLDLPNPYVVWRFLVYLTLAVSLGFYLSAREYRAESGKIDKKIKQIISSENKTLKENYLERIYKEREKKTDLFYVFDTLGKLLSEGSIIRRIYIGEDTMELSIVTKDPLIILNNLHWEKCFSNIKLTSPLETKQELYQIELKISLDRCRYPEKL